MSYSGEENFIVQVGSDKHHESREAATQHYLFDLTKESLPKLQSFGYQAVAYLGGNKLVGRSTFLVQRIRDDKKFVLKMVRFHETNWDHVRQVAEREYRALCCINSSSIPEAVELLNPTQEAWVGVVQTYIPGTRLSEISLSTKKIFDVAKGLLEILAEIHKCGWCHLDVKPDNILIGSDEKPYMIDFGSSVPLDVKTSNDNNTLFGLTPGYADPRVVMGHRRPDERSDLYSLGCTLLSLLLNLSAEEFVNQHGYIVSTDTWKPLSKPNEIPDRSWLWIESLICFWDEKRQSSSAQDALKQLNIIRPDKSGKDIDEISTRQKAVGIFSTLGFLLIGINCVWMYGAFSLGMNIYSLARKEASSDALSIAEKELFTNEAVNDSALGDAIRPDNIGNSGPEAAPVNSKFSILKNPVGKLAASEDKNVAIVYFSDAAYDILKKDFVAQDDGYLNAGFDYYIDFVRSEYETLLTGLDSLEQVDVRKIGITLQRKEGSSESWIDIIREVESLLQKVADDSYEGGELQESVTLKCQPECDSSMSPEAVLHFSLQTPQGPNWSRLGISDHQLKESLQKLAAVQKVSINQDSDSFTVRQWEHYQEPWPVVEEKLEAVLNQLL